MLAHKLQLAALLVTAILLFAYYLSRPAPVTYDEAEVLREAELALARRDESALEDSLSVLLSQDDVSSRALLLAGELAFHRQAIAKSLGFYSRVPVDGSPSSIHALIASAEIHFSKHEFEQAEPLYRQALLFAPNQPVPHEQLCSMYHLEGRRFESIPHLIASIRLENFDVKDLCMLSNMDAVTHVNPKEVGTSQLESQPAYQVGRARYALKENNLDEAQKLLESAVLKAPELLEARVWLGRVYVLKGDAAAFRVWGSSLPEEADGHPEIWMSRGLWELEQEKYDSAARCFWEGLRIEPNFSGLCNKLVESLIRLGRSDEASRLATWESHLAELAIISQRVYDDPQRFQAENVLRASALTEEMGRLWESLGWSLVAHSMDSTLQEAQSRAERVIPQLKPDLPRNIEKLNPISRLDLSNLPLPQYESGSDTMVPHRVMASSNDSERASSKPEAIRFVEEARQRGIKAEYFFSEDRSSEGGQMFEFTGGGTAVLDYDRNGLVDFYFSQGTQWPPDPQNEEYLDWLFSQRVDGQFINVARDAGIVESAFSQGIAVGDFDQDGFQDLYVGNIGKNCLLLNNGDGTYAEITDAVGITVEKWTTSVSMADLNADGLPDLFDVDYVQADDVYERICIVDGHGGACAPTAFAPEQDEVWLNTGDGGVKNVTEESGLSRQQGNGLGLMMFRLPGTLEPRLFVANDMSANHVYVCEFPEQAGGVPALRESGTLTGVAYSAEGKAQACMGIALSDFDHDGQFDLFVTNFEHEYNTLYRPYAEGFYQDDSLKVGLTELSVPNVSFGTEFMDADLDGYPDLFLVNGHVDVFRHPGATYEQAPQVYYNNQGRSFSELPGEQLGEFFRPLYRGRSLSSTDWNRDGRMDVIVSHLDGPIALLTSATQTDSHFVTFRFVATTGDREALTTIVRITTADGIQIGQLTGGGGYQCSNERIVHFGLGAEDQIDVVEVEWPDGSFDKFPHLSADRVWLIHQDHDRAFDMSIRRF